MTASVNRVDAPRTAGSQQLDAQTAELFRQDVMKMQQDVMRMTHSSRLSEDNRQTVLQQENYNLHKAGFPNVDLIDFRDGHIITADHSDHSRDVHDWGPQSQRDSSGSVPGASHRRAQGPNTADGTGSQPGHGRRSDHGHRSSGHGRRATAPESSADDSANPPRQMNDTGKPGNEDHVLYNGDRRTIHRDQAGKVDGVIDKDSSGKQVGSIEPNADGTYTRYDADHKAIEQIKDLHVTKNGALEYTRVATGEHVYQHQTTNGKTYREITPKDGGPARHEEVDPHEKAPNSPPADHQPAPARPLSVCSLSLPVHRGWCPAHRR